MHILITGGTGFIGSRLSRHFIDQGQQVTVLSRTPYLKPGLPKAVRQIGSLVAGDEPYDVIINLAGAPLNQRRWNSKVKKILCESRIRVTQKVIDYIARAAVKPALLISGSAVGFYGSSLEEIFTEASEPADAGFTHQLCEGWEKTAMAATAYGTRVCIMRTGIVLGKKGGILSVMLPSFHLGLGAQLGAGTQWISWVHLDDVVGMIDLLVLTPELHGPFNFTSPFPVTQAEFCRHLAHVLNRPCLLRLPPVLVRGLFGEMGEILLLRGQKVLPERMLQAGYQFQFPELDKALKNTLWDA